MLLVFTLKSAGWKLNVHDFLVLLFISFIFFDFQRNWELKCELTYLCGKEGPRLKRQRNKHYGYFEM